MPRLRVLDACLSHLEEASERGLQRVSVGLAGRLPYQVPGLVPGILTRDAIELVFHEQERCLHPGPAAASAPLDRTQARTLTDRIRRSRGDQSLLMLEAHGRRAWRALGYRSWEGYVREEFGLSRSRSYELLDHGRVVGRLKAALRIDVTPDISPAAAARIAPRLGEVIAELRGRVAAGMAEREVRRAVREVAGRAAADVNRCASRGAAAELDAALDRLIHLKPAGHLLPMVPRLREAAARLGDLADALEHGAVTPECPENRTDRTAEEGW